MRATGVALLLGLVGAAGAEAAAPPDPLRTAVRRGLWRLEAGSASYVTKRTCFSCHHQALPLAAFAAAQARGFAVGADARKKQVDFTLGSFRGKHDSLVKGLGVPGSNTTATYALFTLEAVGHKPDETTAALVEYLLVRQRPDGSWPASTRRPPSEGSSFTTTALALQALKAYGPAKGEAADLRKRVDAAFARGKGWLLKNKPADTEDKLFRLRGLVTAGAAEEAAAARAALLREQRPDGSWAQLSGRPGDAYATGAVLVALRRAGLKPTDPAFAKGVAYLLRTQTPEGAWLVTTRSRPVQVFFDNGDPGGKSQFISFAATGWAVLALLEAVPER